MFNNLALLPPMRTITPYLDLGQADARTYQSSSMIPGGQQRWRISPSKLAYLLYPLIGEYVV